MLRGDRIAALTDFERGVWLAYQLLADDYGVMRFSAIDLQKAVWLEDRPKKAVQRGIEQVAKVGLIHTFQDGDRTQCYQRDWQYWQKVRHPRATLEPCPPVAELLQCDRSTQELFRQHPRCSGEFVRKDSGNTPAELPQDSGLTRAGALAHGKRQTANGDELPAGHEPATPDGPLTSVQQRASGFAEWYEDAHTRVLGVAYMGGNQDWQKALELCEKFTDAQLRDAALVWFGMDDEFTRKGNRTVAKFASRIAECLQKARAIA